MELNEKVKYWVDISDYDLETAKAMLETKRFLYVGFMCHQTVEKILKGYFFSIMKKQAPYIHNLKILANSVGLFEQLSDEQKMFLNEMMPFNIEARYPSYKEDLVKQLSYERCKSIIKTTEEFSKWIKKKL